MRNSLRLSAIVLGQVAFAAALIFLVPWWTTQQRAILVGTGCQILGIVFAATPDLEDHARHIWRKAMEWARAVRQGTRPALRRAWRRAYNWFNNTVLNAYRRLRGRGQVHLMSSSGRIRMSGNVSAVVKRGGTVEQRLERLEYEVMALPAEWRQEMRESRERRIVLRWWGLTLILVGLVAMAAGSL